MVPLRRLGMLLALTLGLAAGTARGGAVLTLAAADDLQHLTVGQDFTVAVQIGDDGSGFSIANLTIGLSTTSSAVTLQSIRPGGALPDPSRFTRAVGPLDSTGQAFGAGYNGAVYSTGSTLGISGLPIDRGAPPITAVGDFALLTFHAQSVGVGVLINVVAAGNTESVRFGNPRLLGFAVGPAAVVPEPATLVPAGIALTCLVGRRRHRRGAARPRA